MTDRDKKDSIRGRMAGTGEPYNVARRKVEAAAAGRSTESEDPYRLIEVEVGSDGDPDRPRHIESFWGRWVVEPDPEKARRDHAYGDNRSVYYGVARTRRGRIVVYRGKGYPPITAEQIEKDRCWAGELDDYHTLADAHLPEDVRRKAAAELDVRDVVHRDI